MVNGVPNHQFSLNVAAADKKKPETPKEEIMNKKLSALKYGRPKELVEAEIAKRARL